MKCEPCADNFLFSDVSCFAEMHISFSSMMVRCWTRFRYFRHFIVCHICTTDWFDGVKITLRKCITYSCPIYIYMVYSSYILYTSRISQVNLMLFIHTDVSSILFSADLHVWIFLSFYARHTSYLFNKIEKNREHSRIDLIAKQRHAYELNVCGSLSFVFVVSRRNNDGNRTIKKCHYTTWKTTIASIRTAITYTHTTYIHVNCKSQSLQKSHGNNDSLDRHTDWFRLVFVQNRRQNKSVCWQRFSFTTFGKCEFMGVNSMCLRFFPSFFFFYLDTMSSKIYGNTIDIQMTYGSMHVVLRM